MDNHKQYSYFFYGESVWGSQGFGLVLVSDCVHVFVSLQCFLCGVGLGQVVALGGARAGRAA